jgi:hypothetical protein
VSLRQRILDAKDIEEKIRLIREYYRNMQVVKHKLPIEEIDKMLEEGPVIEMGASASPTLKETLAEYGEKYGRLPKEIYGEIQLESVESFVKEIMGAYEVAGYKTLSEIEICISKKEPFEGPRTFAMQEGDNYRIYVRPNELIYDETTGYFESQYRRLQIYSEIQHMIAEKVFKKDLAQIRKEAKKKKG